MKTSMTHWIIPCIALALLASSARGQVSDCSLTFDLEVGCNPDGTGYAIVSNFSGTTGFTEIHWDGNEALGGYMITGLTNGSHTVSVTDGVTCETLQAFTVECAPTPPEDCQFRTQTQGGWGAPAHGNNPGVYRNAHFASAFPSGLEIGCVNKLRLTTAAAVQAFLPSGTSGRRLDSGVLVNPGTSYRNVLAGQLVALTLSVGFDNHDPNFGTSSGYLANAVINNGSFTGWTVQMLLDEANRYIGGCPSFYSSRQLTGALAMVNENFDNGSMDAGNLSCGAAKMKEPFLELRLYPNPAVESITLDLGSAGAIASISVIDATGRVVAQLATQTRDRLTVIDVSDLVAGAYFIKARIGEETVVKRFAIQR